MDSMLRALVVTYKKPCRCYALAVFRSCSKSGYNPLPHCEVKSDHIWEMRPRTIEMEREAFWRADQVLATDPPGFVKLLVVT